MSSTKEFILETSFKLFLNKGYRNTSMSNLVTETKLSKGAFYHYFKNKEELYQEVINRYFISYYKSVDWDSLKDMNLVELEMMIKEFYKSFVPEILALTKKGMSRYFILFFEAYEEYPKFKEEVRYFYEQINKVLIQRLKKGKVENPVLEATNLIAKYEGLMFWISVFPEQKIESLIK
ncbi:MAG: AcrR family transcriptional regulator [Maribacter sp.]|jgi:AcrR family transcriptional regulator